MPFLRATAGRLLLAVTGLGAWLLLSAPPAGAHTAQGGSLPAPPWLLAYAGVAVLLITALVLRSTWPRPRLTRFALEPEPPGGSPRPLPPLAVGLLGVVLFATVYAAAIVGPDQYAANIAPNLVMIVWWLGLPIVCVLLGDVVRWINPFTAVLRLVDHRTERPSTDAAPAWLPAAFIASFGWYFLAYHSPGSPRALAVYLGAYSVVALAAGWRWGHQWLATHEGFGGLSSTVGLLAPRRGAAPDRAAIAPLMVVWLGGATFDALSTSSWWVDVLGTHRGWARTLLDSVGLLWVTAIVAGGYLLVVRFAERSTGRPALAAVLAVALVPMATAWFIAHYFTLLLLESQNTYAALSDPISRGWNLFGTINRTIDYSWAKSRWLRWLQLLVLVAGHAGAVVVLHDRVLTVGSRRAGMRATWAMTGLAGASLVAFTLLVLKGA